MSEKVINKNCRYCSKYETSCKGDDKLCLCRICPRNLGECLITKYCRETESVLDLEIKESKSREILIEEYFKNR